MGSRRSSTLQTILSKYFFSDPSDVRCSPLTSVDATETQSKDVAASSDPLDRSALIARLQTFQPGHWFAKPAEVSALVCASHGWLNSGVDTLQCSCCSNVLTFYGTKNRVLSRTDPDVVEFVARLRSGHHAGCPWAHPQPTHQELVAFPTCDSEPICHAFMDRISNLACLEALPRIAVKGLHKLIDGRLDQVLSLLDAPNVPVKASQDSQSENDTSAVHEMSMLTRRSTAFAQTVKLLALLGWTLQPLAGRTPNSDGEYCMKDCMLKCNACGAFMGLWSLDAAPETVGKLGHHGLVGQWGPGRQAHSRSLREFSIAGGLEQDSNARQCIRSGSGDGQAALASTPMAHVVQPFGAATSGPVFGSSVSLAANAKATRAPLGAKKPRHTCVHVPEAAMVGKKRSREPETDSREPIQTHAAKVMRRLSARQQCHLDPDIVAKLGSRGLQACSQGAMEIVHGHRAWCPWVFPDGVEGWRRALNAVVPEPHADTAGVQDVGSFMAHHVDTPSDAHTGRLDSHRSSILHSVTGFLNRFNHGQTSPEVDTE
eukprot:jgi/Ulvmu1/4697/UM002_0428.1